MRHVFVGACLWVHVCGCMFVGAWARGRVLAWMPAWMWAIGRAGVGAGVGRCVRPYLFVFVCRVCVFVRVFLDTRTLCVCVLTVVIIDMGVRSARDPWVSCDYPGGLHHAKRKRKRKER